MISWRQVRKGPVMPQSRSQRGQARDLKEIAPAARRLLLTGLPTWIVAPARKTGIACPWRCKIL
eukprot:5640949-Amphidinium_carterae.1